MSRLQWIHGGRKGAAAHIILCHGFGANASDLQGVAPLIDPDGRLAFHFPEAPFTLFPDARAWFPSDPKQLGDALSGELWRNLPDYDSPAMDDSLSALLQDIDDLRIAPEALVIGGFSQGSMMSLLAALSRPCAATVLLSGLGSASSSRAPRVPPSSWATGARMKSLPGPPAEPWEISSRLPVWRWNLIPSRGAIGSMKEKLAHCGLSSSKSGSS
jgi:predicted esterase